MANSLTKIKVSPFPSPKPSQFEKKVMLSVWEKTQGTFHYDILKSGKTVDSKL